MADSVLWFREDRRHFYEVPAGVELLPGETPLVSVTGERRRVDTAALAAFEIPAEEARRRFTGGVEEAWNRLLGGLAAAFAAVPAAPADNPLKALGERIRTTPPDASLLRAGEKLRGALASPELAHALDEVGAKLQDVARRLREHAAAPPPAAPSAPPADPEGTPEIDPTRVP